MKESCKFLDFPPRSIQNGFVHRFHSHFAALLIAKDEGEGEAEGQRGDQDCPMRCLARTAGSSKCGKSKLN